MSDKTPTTEIMDKLFLELSQFTTAKTARDIENNKRIAELEARIEAVMNLPTYNGYLVPNDVYNQLGDEGE